MHTRELEGFVYVESTESVIDEAADRDYRATNRSWSGINRVFDGLPELCIRETLKFPEYDTPLAVLDVGAGIKRVASEQLQGKRFVGKHLAVTGIDAVIRSDLSYNATQLVGNFLNMPFDDDSFDLAYSRQAVSVVGMSKPETLGTALNEVARVLRPNGVAFIDIDPGWKEYDQGLPTNGQFVDMPKFLGKMGTFRKLRDILTENEQSRYNFVMLASGLGASLLESLAAKGKDIEVMEE
jgi:SAM-dependent methyltransferase